jgi:hypothetical protein
MATSMGLASAHKKIDQNLLSLMEISKNIESLQTLTGMKDTIN